MDEKTAKSLIDDLTQKINQFSELYYSTGESGIDDDAFDLLMDQLAKLETEYPRFKSPDSPTQRVGGTTDDLFKNVVHEVPMLSLSNLYNEDDLTDWIQSIHNRLESDEVTFVCEIKIDGVAMSVIYKNGVLKQAITRGNGEIGEDVTANVMKIQSLPHKIHPDVSVILRGEVFLPKERFNAINQKKELSGESLFKNPRNAAAGSIRLKDPNLVADRGLDILLYDIVDGQTSPSHLENLEYIESLSIPVNPYISKCDTREEILNFCSRWENSKKDLPFDIDGVVIKVDNLNYRTQLGMTAKSPRWATAWKFKAEKVKTKLRNVENSIGRTGILTPVANLDPVQLLGTEVKRATLHNYDQILRLDIHENDTLFVEKGGDIIPKIVGVDYTQRDPESLPIQPPQKCPVCQSKLVKPELEVDLRCENISCPAVIEGKLEHFVSKKCMDIQHFGTAMIKLFLKEKLIETIPDIYRLPLKLDQIIQFEGFGEKSANNLVDAIEKSKTASLARFIHAMGIPHIGEKAAKTLAINCGTLSVFVTLTEEMMETYSDFGPIMIESVGNWLRTPENQAMITDLINLGISPTPVEISKNRPYQGKTCVITGTLSRPRQEWKQKLESVGFNISSSVSKKTDYILVGENAGSKLEKAEKLNIQTVSETEMETLISSTTV